MKSKGFSTIAGLLFLFSGFFLTNTLSAQDNAGKVMLSYNYPDTPVKYKSSNKILQIIDVNGDLMEVNVVQTLGCTIRSKGKDGNDIVLDVTIDTLGRTIDSPAGHQGGTMKEGMGKYFPVKISISGEETDLSGAEQINYNDGSGSRSNAAELFSGFFPYISNTEMTPGYTWTSVDTLTTRSSSTTTVMMVKSENTFGSIRNNVFP